MVPAKYRFKTILLSEIAVGEEENIQDPVLITEYAEYSSIMEQIKEYLQKIIIQLENTLEP